MLRSGARWRDCPPEYGPYTTIYNRFSRWSRQGIWLDMFKALTGNISWFGTASIDSSHAKAHRSAARLSRAPCQTYDCGHAVPRSLHVFRVVQCQFGYRKVRYRGIAKNGAQVLSLLALANLYLARRTFAAA
jgi:hypothetical protein